MKKYIKKLFKYFGYEIRKPKKSSLNKTSDLQRGLITNYLTKVSNPKTVIDVGVGYGTPELYNAYPNAKFILIEPLKQFKPFINKIKKELNCKVYYKAVGSVEEKKSIKIDENNLQKSSFASRTEITKTGNRLKKSDIETTTINKILDENTEIETPILLKIDTEGHELEILKGSDKYLNQIDTIISEVSVAQRFENSYNFEDIILFLYNKGFQVFDFPNIKYLKNMPGTQYVDIIFKRV
jgi:FkbM family methyltransferase